MNTYLNLYKHMHRLRIWLVCGVVLFISGCLPHKMIEYVDSMLPPPGYKPKYMNSSVRLDSLAKEYEAKQLAGKTITFDSAAMEGMYDSEADADLYAQQDSTSGNNAETTDETVEQKRIDSLIAISTGRQRDSLLRHQSDTVRSKRWGIGIGSVTITRRRAAKREASNDTTFFKEPKKLAPATVDVRAVDDSRYPETVSIRATITDSTGRFVMGLAPPRFMGRGTYRNYWRTLVDSCNGTAVTVDSFRVEEVRGDINDPYAVAFVIDQSPSMGSDRIRRLRKAVSGTMSIISKGDMLTVIPFGGKVVVEVPISGDTSRWRAAFNPNTANEIGGTAIYDAAGVAVNELMKAPAEFKKAVILFTDGDDNNSRLSLAEACRVAYAKRIPLYTIAYGGADDSVLTRMSRLTGGRNYRIYTTEEFPYVFADIYRSLKTYYRITYTPPACAGIHHVRFGVALPELGVKRVTGRGTYDRSLFTERDTAGSITFANIEFESGKAVIQPGSMQFIEIVAASLRAHPGIQMEIRGHTDDRGTPDLNARLSQRRAEAVLEALVANGVERKRLSAAGFGSSRPLVSNDSDGNRARNRRTEFVIK
ncbi:MAG: OmpA family protein [Candidatus Kapabacteria bacterium]|nr:OmpA family protein [Candidatus Kapabacteria bacterium]